MHISHVALWTRDLDGAAEFWARYFGATIGARYASQRRAGFVSRFADLPGGGARIELMTGPWVEPARAAGPPGWDHVAITLDDADAVDALAARCQADGCLVSGPRHTGDGYYEAVLAMPDGTPIEITA
jgi:lactoylglutathione lyase